ncbi:hypothetical protein BH11ACT7_BH11ACT7_14940 [soil metagenome]
MKTLGLLRLAAGVSSFDRVVTPALLLSMAGDLEVSLAVMSSAATLYFVLYATLQPVWAVISDYVGRLAVIRSALLAASVAGLVCVLAQSVEVVIAARAVSGGLFAAVVPAALVWIGESLGAVDRKVALALLMGATYTGTLAASLVGATAAQFDLWRVGVAVPAAAALLVALALLRVSSSPAVERQPFGPAVRYCLRRPQALLIIGLAFVEGGVVHGTLTYWPAALEHVGAGPALAGLSVACFGLGVILGSRWVGVTTQSRHRIMMAGGATIAVALAITGATQTLGIGLMLGLAAVLGVGFSALHSSLQGVATEVAPRARSVVIALFAAALFTGGAAGTALASSSASAGNFDLIFVVAALITIPLTLACLATRQAQ